MQGTNCKKPGSGNEERGGQRCAFVEVEGLSLLLGCCECCLCMPCLEGFPNNVSKGSC